MLMEYFNNSQCLCVSTLLEPHLRNLKSRRRAKCLLLFFTVTIFAQMSKLCMAASLPHNEDSSIESTQLGEDMTNFLTEITKHLRHREDLEDVRESLSQKLHKRHNSVLKVDNANEANPELENICGSEDEWSGDEIPDQLKPDYVQMYLKILRKSVHIEYKALKSYGFHDIDIDDMRTWHLHERKYKFLPTLAHNSEISPACWHHGMQIFVASFAYLQQKQQQLDQQYYRSHSGLAHELRALLQSSKRMLCEIQTSIRGSFPREKRNLKFYTREEMLSAINFYTNENMRSNSRQRNINRTDLRFVKFFYQNYLQRILAVLVHHNHNNNNSNMQLQYTCKKQTHHMLLTEKLNTEATNVSNESSYDEDK